MKKRLHLVVTLVVLIVMTLIETTFAQMPQGEGKPRVFRDDAEINSEDYSAIKARALSMIEERRKRLEEEKACVEAAKTASEVRGCRPQPPRRQGGDFQGEPGQRPQQSRPDDFRRP